MHQRDFERSDDEERRAYAGRSVSKYERGFQKNPTLLTLRKLANGLGFNTLSMFFLELERQSALPVRDDAEEDQKMVEMFRQIGEVERDVILESLREFYERRPVRPMTKQPDAAATLVTAHTASPVPVEPMASLERDDAAAVTRPQSDAKRKKPLATTKEKTRRRA